MAVGFEAAFTLGFLDTVVLFDLSAMSLEVVFLGLSAVSLEAVFLEVSVASFFTALVVIVFFGFSLVEDGFFVVVVLFLVEAGFLFSSSQNLSHG